MSSSSLYLLLSFIAGFLFLLNPMQCFQCQNSSMSSNTYQRGVYSISGPTSVDGLIVKIGPVSNDIYYGVLTVTSGTYESIIMRYTYSGSLVFIVKYPGEILINSLCLYGSSENYILYVTKGNPFLSFALNTPDGSMIAKFSNTAGQATNLISGASFESTGQNWFQSLEVPSTSTGLLCYDIVNQGNLRCFTLTGYSIPSTIVAISGLDVFFAASIQGSSDIGLMRASFTTNTILWAKKSA